MSIAGRKIGYTKQQKRTLVTIKKKEHDLIAVTLNGPDDWNDHIQMYESAFKDYKPTEILPEGMVENFKIKCIKGMFTLKMISYPLTKKRNWSMK
jgi:D-alanyl-D-alanine carboxypeptidase